MIVKNTAFSLFYPQLTGLRREIYDIEESLKDYFNLFTVLAIPDNAPPEIPRCQSFSKNGHTELNISLINSLINTRYDDNFNRDWDKCYKYFKETTERINEIIKEKIKNDILFYGLTTQIIYDEYPSSIDLIREKFLKSRIAKKPYEINLRLAFELDEYFINFTFLNERSYNVASITTPGITSLAGAKEVGNYLTLILDINNKNGFNTRNGYKSSQKDFKFIFSKTNEIVVEKMPVILETGEVKL